MAIFDGHYKQAGSIDAQNEGALLAYHAYLIAQEEAGIESTHAYHQHMQREEEHIQQLQKHQAKAKKAPLQEILRLKQLPDNTLTLLKELIDQFKKRMLSHEQSMRKLVKELKVMAKQLGIEEKTVDEFVTHVDKEVATALPIRDPESSTTTAPIPLPVVALPKPRDPELELGFSMSETKRAVDVKQTHEQAKKTIFSRLFEQFFGPSFKRNQDNHDSHADILSQFTQSARSVVNEAFESRSSIVVTHIQYSITFSILPRPNINQFRLPVGY